MRNFWIQIVTLFNSARALVLVTGATAVIVLFGISNYQTLSGLMEEANWVRHTHEVLESGQRIEKLLVDLETGQRGFLITGQEEFLEPFVAAKRDISTTFQETKQLVVDNPAQVARLIEAEEKLEEWYTKAGETEIDLRRQINDDALGAADLQRVLGVGVGKGILDNIRTELDSLDAFFLQLNNEVGRRLALSIAKDMVDQETGQRGYLVTGKEEFLEPFVAGGVKLISDIEALHLLLDTIANGEAGRSANAVARRTLERVEKLAQRWRIEAAQPEIAIRRSMLNNTATLSDVVEHVRAQIGKNLMDQMRSILSQFRDEEAFLLSQRESTSEAAANRAVLEQALGNALFIALAFFMFKLSASLTTKSNDLETEREKMINLDWVKSNFVQLSSHMQSCKKLAEANKGLMQELVPLIGGQQGLLYLAEGIGTDIVLILAETYAFGREVKGSRQLKSGEGLAGQCGRDGKTILLTRYEDGLSKIAAASTDIEPRNIIVFPISYKAQLLAVIEISTAGIFTAPHLDLIKALSEGLGLVLNNMMTSIQTAELLMQAQAQSEELENQKDSLSDANSQLEEQTMQLQSSEEELRVANEELTERQEILAKKQAEVEAARIDAESKAIELAQSSKYKSEFLANMSHELRTPLNSLLILSRMLAENTEGNLTASQIEDAQIIYDGGNSLLALINDIMDLSKIEAGKLDMHYSEVRVAALCASMQALFQPISDEKKLTFEIKQETDPLMTFRTDDQRVEQILKNFLSNALKFTSEGSVTLRTHSPTAEERQSCLPNFDGDIIGFSITDTGIGITEEKQASIFEAFQQEDGSTSRDFGGTGLGLTISQNLATLLGGQITLQSEKDKGSTFTLWLPIDRTEEQAASHIATSKPETPRPAAPSKGKSIQDAQTRVLSRTTLPTPGSMSNAVLIIEDDDAFAGIITRFARDNGIDAVVAKNGRDGVMLAVQCSPRAIVLDIGLPDISGLEVLEQLKDGIDTRHIPVHVISGGDHERKSLHHGAVNFLSKPSGEADIRAVLESMRNENTADNTILVIEDDKNSQKAIERLIGRLDVRLSFASSGKAALDMLSQQMPDCIILDLGLPDMNGYDLLKKIAKWEGISKVPIIVYTAADIGDEEQALLDSYAADVIIKGAESPERLLDDISLFMHSVVTDMSEDQRKSITMLHDPDRVLKGRPILLVDDDMRNLFALSKHLGNHGLDVDIAENGQTALDKLQERQDTGEAPYDAILMDIMMPVMDGYVAMGHIRDIPSYKDTPIIALTAKAMQDDRAKCIDAGASEYLAKPINVDSLMSMLRIWLYRTNE